MLVGSTGKGTSQVFKVRRVSTNRGYINILCPVVVTVHPKQQDIVDRRCHRRCVDRVVVRRVKGIVVVEWTGRIRPTDPQDVAAHPWRTGRGVYVIRGRFTATSDFPEQGLVRDGR